MHLRTRHTRLGAVLGIEKSVPRMTVGTQCGQALAGAPGHIDTQKETVDRKFEKGQRCMYPRRVRRVGGGK